MSAFKDASIAEALFDRVGTLALSPSLDVSMPNMPFTPPESGRWLRVNEIPAPTAAFEVSGGTREFTGLLQVDVFHPLGDGRIGAKETAGAIVNHFLPPLVLEKDGVRVRITQAYPGPVLQDGRSMMLPVTIRYRAFA